MKSYAFTILLVFCLLTTLPAAHASFVIRSQPLRGTTYVYLDDVAAYYGMNMVRKGDHLSLEGSHRAMTLKLKSRRGTINGYQFDFGFAVLADKVGKLVMAQSDFVQIVDPILRDWSVAKRAIRRIVIDPGHGGKDEGARSSRGVKEKDVVLRVGLHLQQILASQGYEVIMTRSTDKFLTLDKRTTFKADLFISLHCNKSGSAAAAGIETWYCTPVGQASTYSKRVCTGKDPGNAYDRSSVRLAYEIQRYAVHETKAQDRGPRKERWRVVAQATSPAVLIEMGFLSNAAEEDKLATDAYQKEMAMGIAGGIISFHRVVANQR